MTRKSDAVARVLEEPFPSLFRSLVQQGSLERGGGILKQKVTSFLGRFL